MAKYFHRLPNGDFKIFDSESEYLAEISESKYPIKTMFIIGLLFVIGAIWSWNASDYIGNFFLLGCGAWTIGFTILFLKIKKTASDTITALFFLLPCIPIFLVIYMIMSNYD